MNERSTGRSSARSSNMVSRPDPPGEPSRPRQSGGSIASTTSDRAQPASGLQCTPVWWRRGSRAPQCVGGEATPGHICAAVLPPKRWKVRNDGAASAPSRCACPAGERTQSKRGTWDASLAFLGSQRAVAHTRPRRCGCRKWCNARATWRGMRCRTPADLAAALRYMTGRPQCRAWALKGPTTNMRTLRAPSDQ